MPPDPNEKPGTAGTADRAGFSNAPWEMRGHFMSSNEALSTFGDAMRAVGIEAPESIIGDGQIHRFGTGGKRSKNGWYVLHLDGVPAGAFGDWRTGVNETWTAVAADKLPQADRDAQRRRLDEIKRQREAEQVQRHAEAQAKAGAIWQASAQAPADHPYLVRKGIQAHGVRSYKGSLVVPVRDLEGALHSLQFITGDGEKRFLTDGRIAGCMHVIGDLEKAPTVAVCEGFATGASIAQETGHAVVCAFNAGNLEAVTKAVRRSRMDARLIVAADDDSCTDGNPGTTKATAAARAAGALLALPDFGANRPNGATDFNDLAQHRPGAVAECIGNAKAPDRCEPRSAPANAGKAARPVIDIRTGYLPTTVDACEQALIQSGAPIYARGEMLARAIPAPLEPGNVKRAAGALILTAVTIAALQDDLERIADFQRWTNGPNGPEPKRADAPAKACRALLERVGRWRFSQLRGIALAPFIRADGSIACTPGYDRESGLLLAIPSDWPQPPSNPTRADALAALARLRHLIRTFAFVTPEDESVAIAAMLSPFVRPAIEAAPMFGYSAPVRGSGKSMLADLVAILATGRAATAMTWGPDADENSKALASALLAGDAVMMLDNVETPLRGELLCSALTQSSLRLRPLGRSELVTIPCVATLMATGNALTPAGDMTRRVLVAELDPQCERPELREFTNDPKADALAERAELVCACLTIIKAGMRDDYRRSAPLGSYGQWSRLVRDPLVWLGMPDPVAVMERTFDQDPERESAIAILAAWREVYGTGSATAAEAAKAAPTHAALSDALESIATRAGTVSTKALGRWLRRHEGRVLGGLKVQKAGGDAKHGIRWRVAEHVSDGVSRVSGVSLPASRTEGGTSTNETKTQRPNETPKTRETPSANDAEEWGDVA